MSDRLDALRGLSIFGGLSDPALLFLDGRLEPVEVAAGDAFFAQGDLGDCLFVLDAGSAEVVKSRGGRSLVLSTLSPGDCFGEIALIGICPRTATVRATTGCRALRLPSRALLELYREQPKQFTLVQMNLGREIARRLAALDEVVFEVAATCDAAPPPAPDGPAGANDRGGVMAHPREEIQATLERFVEANRLAEQDGNWERLADFYTEDAVYVYAGLAANGMVEARGREEIRRLVLARDMEPYRGWTFPHEWAVIDGDRIVTKWQNRGPGKRPDGSFHEAPGISVIDYAGGGKFKSQWDLYDRLSVKAVKDEVDAAGG